MWNKDGLEVKTKNDGTYVSDADTASEKCLIEGILNMFPDHGIVSEESPLSRALPAGCSSAWIIDPLDGTSEFINGTNNFSIQVAYCDNGEISAGFVFFPAQDRFVQAVSGFDSTLNGHPLRVSRNVGLTEQKIYVGGCTPPVGDARVVFPKIDSGVALCRVSSGELDGAIIRLGRFGVWDVAAWSLIVRLSGGQVSGLDGSPLKFEGGNMSSTTFVASNRTLHSDILRLANECRS
jgi:myo-inositol-1(or 4)-monophosphatase